MGLSNSSSLSNTVILSFYDYGIKNMTYLLPFNTGKYLEQKNLRLSEPKSANFIWLAVSTHLKNIRQNGFIFPK